jgi:hypothetical protein
LRKAAVSVLAGLARVAALARLSPAERVLLQLVRRVLLLDGARAASRGADERDLRVRTAPA